MGLSQKYLTTKDSKDGTKAHKGELFDFQILCVLRDVLRVPSW